MFFIVSGVVEVLSDDNLKVLARFHEGQFFGEIAVLLDVPRIANVRAVSEVEVFVLTKDNLEAVFQVVPGAAEAITSEGHRLYRNWLRITQGEDQAMEEGIDLSHESLNSPYEQRAPSIRRQSSMSDSGVVVPQGTDQDIHPVEAGHPAGKPSNGRERTCSSVRLWSGSTQGMAC